MEGQPTANTGASVLNRLGLDHLIEVLRARGYCVVGPTVEDSAIVLVELESGVQLPSGWGVTTGAGTYRLRRRDDTAVFGHSAGPQSWKRFLHPPRQQQCPSTGTVPSPDRATTSGPTHSWGSAAVISRRSRPCAGCCVRTRFRQRHSPQVPATVHRGRPLHRAR